MLLLPLQPPPMRAYCSNILIGDHSDFASVDEGIKEIEQ
ncbi:hypothetical protein BT93_I1648 [Corymbia citriodora subsp. variegata]|nr:hypothetical protein BT93_I1648 [Corymbia citriodora subsp. variegata]